MVEMKLRRFAAAGVLLLALTFGVAGGVMLKQGADTHKQVVSALVSKDIVGTPDSSIPNVRVHDMRTAKAMADIIHHHTLTATNGKTYAEMPRFATADGKGTNDPAAALKNDGGKPVDNPLRSLYLTGVELRTSLYESVIALGISQLVMGLGALLIVAAIGTALFGVPTVWVVTHKL